MTIETLIANATTEAIATINNSYSAAAGALREYDTKQMGALYFQGWAPVTAFAATSGVTNENTVASVGNGMTEIKEAASTTDWLPDLEQVDDLGTNLGELQASAKESLDIVLADLNWKMRTFLSDVIGASSSFPSISTLTALDYTPDSIDTTADGSAESHEALRKQREYLADIASRGHTYMPGHVVDTVSDIHISRADKRRESAIAVVRAQNEARLSVYNAKIAALGNALNALTRARVSLVGAASEYAKSVKNGIKYAIDSTFFDSLSQLKYDALQVRVLREDANVKQRAVAALNEVISAQSVYDKGLRDYLLAKQKYILDMRDVDYGQYITEQKVTVKTGMQMIETLGRIAAAAEAAMNVVVSSAETSFA